MNRNGSNGERKPSSVKTQILDSPARYIERLFNFMSHKLIDIIGGKIKTLKKARWMAEPDTRNKTKCDNYAGCVSVKKRYKLTSS